MQDSYYSDNTSTPATTTTTPATTTTTPAQQQPDSRSGIDAIGLMLVIFLVVVAAYFKTIIDETWIYLFCGWKFRFFWIYAN